MPETISIIIPCYNEEDSLPNLFSRIQTVVKKLKEKYSVEIIFVDDGSKDKTAKLISDFAKGKPFVKLVKHEKNMNLGAAHRTGFKHAKGDYVAVIDSDCSYDPAHLPEMLDLLKKTGADIVTASPYHPKGGIDGVSSSRLLLSRSINLIYSILLGKKLYTYSAMVRVYKKGALKKISFQSNDFMAVAEILIDAVKKGLKIVEYPDILRRRQFGVSKARLKKEMKNHMKNIYRIIFG